jgi:hypothetical protein
MVYGTVSAKLPCVYETDNGKHLTVHHDQDVITAGTFDTGPGDDGNAPSKKYLKQRHVLLKETAGTRRCKCVIANPSNFNPVVPGTPGFLYGGISWTITGKVGEKSSE